MRVAIDAAGLTQARSAASLMMKLTACSVSGGAGLAYRLEDRRPPAEAVADAPVGGPYAATRCVALDQDGQQLTNGGTLGQPVDHGVEDLGRRRLVLQLTSGRGPRRRSYNPGSIAPGAATS